jgi:thioredoxin-related protein
MRRSIILLFLLTLIVLATASAQFVKPAPAQDILNTALKQATTTDKNVWLIFHASWCVWCKRLDKMLANPEMKAIIDKHYVVTHLDILESRVGKKDSLENPGGAEIATKLGGEKSGLPYFAFLDATGKKLADSNVMPKGQNIGYPATKEEIVEFGKLLEQTAPNMSEQERAQVLTYLEKNSPQRQTQSAGH